MAFYLEETVLTLKQLSEGFTKDEALDWMLSKLQGDDFRVTSWHSGGVVRTMLELTALGASRMSLVVAEIARQMFLKSSAGTGTDSHAESKFGLARREWQPTIGMVTLTGGAVGPPHTVTPGNFLVADPVSGQEFTNTTGFTINASSVLEVEVRATNVGEQGNVDNGDITEIRTPLAGVTVDNPALAPGFISWITTNGFDFESDSLLIERCLARWGELNGTGAGTFYEYLILESDTDITRVWIDKLNPRGPGTVDLFIARATSTATGADVITVQAAIDARKPCSADPLVIAATETPIAITANIWVDAVNDTAETQTAVLDSIDDFINGLPVGGVVFPPATTGVLPQSELTHAITSIDGIRKVQMLVPVGDGAIPAGTVAVSGVVTLNYIRMST